ncbi:MAG: clostripain-related cysteine peptidase [Armatimonadota bacterium]|nr:clostripain-related cysteine peptidase [Armatimonadota bacterium]
MALLWGPAANVPVEAAAAHRVAWTLMIYQDGDTNLETDMIRSLKEILSVGSTADVNIVVLCDRSPKGEPEGQYTNEGVGGLDNWSGTKILYVEKGRLRPVDTWGSVNVGEPATLKRFVDNTSAAFPAQHYGLILDDHGSGWAGICVDESHDDSVLTLPDIRSSLEEFSQVNGKLDFIGFDACLMGNFETAQALAPIAHTMVASEEVEPARGWNYAAALGALVKTPSMSGADWGTTIAETYNDLYAKSTDARFRRASVGITMGVVSLDHMPALQTALDGLADQCSKSLLGGKRPGWVKLARARATAEQYGSLSSRGQGDEQMYDLVQLAQLLQSNGDSEVSTAAAAVTTAAKAVVLHVTHGSGRPNANGLSIFWTPDGVTSDNRAGARYLNTPYSKTGRWVRFLKLYAEMLQDYIAEPDLKTVTTSGPAVSIGTAVNVSAQVTADDVDEADVMLALRDGENVVFIGEIPTRVPPTGALAHHWDGRWFMLSNGKSVVTCPIISFEPLDDTHKHYYVIVPAQIQPAGTDTWAEAVLAFHVSLDGAAPHGEMVFAFADTEDGPREVRIMPGDQVRPVYLQLTADGDVQEWTSSRAATILPIDNPLALSMSWAYVGKGPYLIGFHVTNLEGKAAQKLADVRME